MMYEYLELLLYISKTAGLFGSLETSTLRISREIGSSQQTISRKLREMEKKGLITRFSSSTGLKVRLDDKGRDFLERNFRDLRGVFNSKNSVIFGVVKGGLGEGSYYVSQKPYQDQFKENLGFSAFPGTLNLEINKEELAQFLASKDVIDINGFTTKTRSFGALACYKVKIRNIEMAIVKPERASHSEDVIEIIAPLHLRSSLKLQDGDKVKIS